MDATPPAQSSEPDLRPHCLPREELDRVLAENKPVKRQNWALHRGGDVDVLTLKDGRVLLRLNGVKAMTPDLKKSLAEILTRSGVTVVGYARPEPEPDVLGGDVTVPGGAAVDPAVAHLLRIGGKS